MQSIFHRAVLGRRAAFPHVATALRCRAADNSADTNSGRPNRVGRLQLSPIAYPCPVEFSAREMSEAYVTRASCYSTGVRSSGAKRPTRHQLLATRHGGFAAFTLIELLVVISIIAILAGLAFPAVNGAIGSARKAQARNDVQQIASAIKSFHSEYGYLPSAQTTSEEWVSDNGNLMKILLGEAGQTLNPKNKKFLDPKIANQAKGGLFQGKYYDPWGELYLIKLNTDYDNKIEYYGEKPLDVIVLSKGPNKSQNDINSGDDIFNFK
jgi:prepilin-type N-terminal cleavage/methylation domain-containing protein